MEKKKLKINDIKVSSFVTALDSDDKATVAGGIGNTMNPTCLSLVPACVNSQANFCTNFPSAYDACPTQRGCTIACSGDVAC